MVDETVRSIDLMPTLLDVTGRALPDGLQGQSLVPLMKAAAELPGADATESTVAGLAADLGWQRRPAVSERATTQRSGGPRPRDDEAVSIVLDGWKLIHNTKSSSGRPEFELFEHAKDPLDLENVADEHPDVVEKLLGELQSWRDLTQAGKTTAGRFNRRPKRRGTAASAQSGLHPVAPSKTRRFSSLGEP